MMAGENYKKIVKLGSGSYGNVWLVSDKTCPSQKLVLKEINLRGLDEKDIDQAATEIQVLSQCHHQHIISYRASFVDRELSTLSIVMEHATLGDLHQQIFQRRGLYFPDETILQWFSQLVSALDYIHARRILHRDVKPQNVFVTANQNIKLGDFGISRKFVGPQDKACTLIGTPFYLSPEVCRQDPYSYASDMWSAGCVLYEMCCLTVPFTASNMAALAAKIELGRYFPLPSHCCDLLHTLVQSLLTSDPKRRLTARDVHQMDLKAPKHTKSTVDSTTYTVTNPSKKKLLRPSLASPELTALIHRQRSRPAEGPGQRVVQSAGNPHRNPRQHRDKKSAAPCMNLFQQACTDRKRSRCYHDDDTGDDGGRSDVINKDTTLSDKLQILMEAVYQVHRSSTPQQRLFTPGYKPRTSSETAMAGVIRKGLESILGCRFFQEMLEAVRRKSDFGTLKGFMGQFECDDRLLPLLLLYDQMAD